MSIETQIKEIIAEHLKVNLHKVKNDSDLKNDLDADSIDIVEISMKLETAFDIDIPSDDAEQFLSVQNLIDYVSKLC